MAEGSARRCKEIGAIVKRMLERQLTKGSSERRRERLGNLRVVKKKKMICYKVIMLSVFFSIGSPERLRGDVERCASAERVVHGFPLIISKMS
jgi:hypothetical protein